jgi:hypothetical protein
MASETRVVAGVAGSPYITVTRARTRAYTPLSVCPATTATAGFPAAFDQWIAERCALVVEAFTPTMTLYRDWQAWASRQSIRVGSVKRFSRAIAALGFERFNTRLQRGYRGLVVKLDSAGEKVAVPRREGARVQEDDARRCILALDLGTETGWALRGHNGLITSGTVSLRPGRFEGGGMRYLRFTNWLTEIDRLSGPIAAIWFEGVRRHAGTDASHIYGGLMATLTAWAELRGIPYQGVPVGTIKRHVAAKGNADKTAVIAAVRARGFHPADDNEADALAILLWAIETQGGVR